MLGYLRFFENWKFGTLLTRGCGNASFCKEAFELFLTGTLNSATLVALKFLWTKLKPVDFADWKSGGDFFSGKSNWSSFLRSCAVLSILAAGCLADRLLLLLSQSSLSCPLPSHSSSESLKMLAIRSKCFLSIFIYFLRSPPKQNPTISLDSSSGR